MPGNSCSFRRRRNAGAPSLYLHPLKFRQAVMEDLVEKVKQSTEYIRKHCSLDPEVGIVLGSGLGNLAKEIKVNVEIEYDDIPHFPVSTVEGHHGKLIIGELSGKRIVAMAGRFHFYEGY